MPRKARIILPDTIYHIIWRGNRRDKVFRSNHDRRKFLLQLKDTKEKIPFFLFAFALMPNHIHLLLETKKDAPLSKIMHLLGTRYTIFFNKKYNLVGHLFQDRFKSIVIDSEIYFWEINRYISLNPVKDNLVVKPEDFRWSSYPIMVEETRLLKPRLHSRFEKMLVKKLVNKKEFFERFFSESKEKIDSTIKRFQNFVEEGIKKEIWQEKKWQQHDLMI